MCDQDGQGNMQVLAHTMILFGEINPCNTETLCRIALTCHRLKQTNEMDFSRGVEPQLLPIPVRGPGSRSRSKSSGEMHLDRQ